MSNKSKQSLAIVISILLGISTQFADTNLTAILFALAGLIGIVSIVLIVASFFNRSYLRKGLNGLLCICIFVITTISVKSVVHAYKLNVAREIVSAIEAYKSRTGSYPNKIEEVFTYERIKGLEYQPYDSLNHFKISYMVDGFRKKTYDSGSQEWISQVVN